MYTLCISFEMAVALVELGAKIQNCTSEQNRSLESHNFSPMELDRYNGIYCRQGKPPYCSNRVAGVFVKFLKHGQLKCAFRSKFRLMSVLQRGLSTQLAMWQQPAFEVLCSSGHVVLFMCILTVP